MSGEDSQIPDHHRRPVTVTYIHFLGKRLAHPCFHHRLLDTLVEEPLMLHRWILELAVPC